MTAETAETLRQKAFEAVADAIGNAYDCDRVWTAWEYGTMSDDDSSLVSQNPDRVCEITDAALNAVGFDDILKERNKLREERDRLRKAIEDAVNDINYTVMEMGAKA